MITYGGSAKDILERIQGDSKGSSHLRRYRQLFAIARGIRERAVEEKITVREFASRMGTSVSQAQRIMSLEDPANMTIDTLLRAGQAVGLDIEIRLRRPGLNMSYVQRAGFGTVKALEGPGASCAPKNPACSLKGIVHRTTTAKEVMEPLKADFGG